MKLRKLILVSGVVLSLSLILGACGKAPSGEQSSKTKYPQKTIKIVEFVPDGMGPDYWAKQVSNAMAKQTGWKIEYTYAPGNMGSDAANQVWAAPHDGYTVLALSENALQWSTAGLTKTTTKDWKYFEDVQERSLFVTYPNSPYKTVEDLVKAAKAKPDTIRVGQVATGSSFDMKLAALEKVTGVKFKHVEFPIGKGMIEGVENKQVDAVISPMILVLSEIGKGNIIPLGMSDIESFDFGGSVGKVDSIGNAYPEYKKYLPLDAVGGFAMPADAPKEAADTFGKAFDNAMNSPEVQDSINKNNAIKVGIWGEDAQGYMAKMESNYTWLLKDVGMTKIDPATLGIPKPEVYK